jgi:hypothetical protein
MERDSRMSGGLSPSRFVIARAGVVGGACDEPMMEASPFIRVDPIRQIVGFGPRRP